MSTEKTKKTSAPLEARTPEEVSEYNDQVWDMVLRKIHVVALYVFLQIVLVSLLQTQAVYEEWAIWIYLPQFLGAWTVFYGTLLRDMGFRSWSGLILIGLAIVALIPMVLGDPLAWNDSWVQGLLLSQTVPAFLLWLLTLFRWRILKRQFLDAQAKGIIS